MERPINAARPDGYDLLAIEGVTKSYGALEALRGVHLRIGTGELVGLLGPNGAGKSTLFQICCGLFAADDGKVELFGKSYRDHPGAILSQLAVVFQSRSLDLDVSRGKVPCEGTPEALIAQIGAEDLTGAYVAQTGIPAAPT